MVYVDQMRDSKQILMYSEYYKGAWETILIHSGAQGDQDGWLSHMPTI